MALPNRNKIMTEPTTPTREHAEKILKLLSYGLPFGNSSEPVLGGMCVEAVVCHALGEPHGDAPSCVGVKVRSAKIRLNDSAWSSDTARAEGMKRIAIAQLGSDKINQIRFEDIINEKVIRRIIPMVLRKKANNSTPDYADELEQAALACENLGNFDAAKLAREVAAMYSVERQTIDAVCYSDSMFGVYWAAEILGDTVLIEGAKIIEEALIELECPGVQFLDLIQE